MDELTRRLRAALARDTGPTSDFDLNAGAIPPRQTSLRGAGVLVAVTGYGPAPAVILTKRASHLSQHPGQVAFPGGKIDAGDADAIAAALREAGEEIGLPFAAADVLGPLPTHETVTGYSITPVLAVIRVPFDAVAEQGEVAEIFHVPLAHLAEPANYLIGARMWRGRERRYYTVPYGPYYIWGATARILRGLAHRMQP